MSRPAAAKRDGALATSYLARDAKRNTLWIIQYRRGTGNQPKGRPASANQTLTRR